MACVTIREDRCKGCGLCVSVCPRKILALSKTRFNTKGYNPAECVGQFCNVSPFEPLRAQAFGQIAASVCSRVDLSVGIYIYRRLLQIEVARANRAAFKLQNLSVREIVGAEKDEAARTLRSVLRQRAAVDNDFVTSNISKHLDECLIRLKSHQRLLIQRKVRLFCIVSYNLFHVSMFE